MERSVRRCARERAGQVGRTCVPPRAALGAYIRDT